MAVSFIALILHLIFLFCMYVLHVTFCTCCLALGMWLDGHMGLLFSTHGACVLVTEQVAFKSLWQSFSESRTIKWWLMKRGSVSHTQCTWFAWVQSTHCDNETAFVFRIQPLPQIVRQHQFKTSSKFIIAWWNNDENPCEKTVAMPFIVLTLHQHCTCLESQTQTRVGTSKLEEFHESWQVRLIIRLCSTTVTLHQWLMQIANTPQRLQRFPEGPKATDRRCWGWSHSHAIPKVHY